ncbi:hypothetical protein Tco_0474270 [Tanacetum coccineum]
MAGKDESFAGTARINCLVKEQKKEYQTRWKIKTGNVLDSFWSVQGFLGRGYNMSTYLVNRSPSSAIGFKTPIDMLGIFGWLASIKQGMLEPVMVKCIFLLSVIRLLLKDVYVLTMVAEMQLPTRWLLLGVYTSSSNIYFSLIDGMDLFFLLMHEAEIWITKVAIKAKGNNMVWRSSGIKCLSGDCDVKKRNDRTYSFFVIDYSMGDQSQELGYELSLVAGIATGALVKGGSRSEVPSQVEGAAYRISNNWYQSQVGPSGGVDGVPSVRPRFDGRRYEKGGIVAIVEGEAHGGLGLRGGLLGVQTQSHIGKIIISKLTYKLGGLLLLSPIGFRMEPQLGLYVRLGEMLGLGYPTIGIRARLGPVVVWMVFPQLDLGLTVLVDPGKPCTERKLVKR